MPLARSHARYILLSIVLTAFTIIVSGSGLAQVPLRQDDSMLKQMLDAIQTTSYEKFIALGDEKFKSGFTLQMFNSLTRQLGPRLQKGYSEIFLTTLHQHDYVVYVWKLTFKDAQDDLLLTLAIRNGSVVGFLTR